MEFFHPGSSVIQDISLPPTPYSYLVSSRSIDLKASSVQSLSYVWRFVTPWTAAHQASLSFTISQSLLNSCPLSQWCHPTISSSVVPFSSCPQSFPASGSFQMSQIFLSGDQNIGVSASASGLSNEYSGLISFRIDWFDLLAVQGTLKRTPMLTVHSLYTHFC